MTIEVACQLSDTLPVPLLAEIAQYSTTGKKWNEYARFSIAFPATLHSPLALTLIYCRYKPAVTKLITAQASYCTESNYFYLVFGYVLTIRDNITNKYFDLNEICILCDVSYSPRHPVHNHSEFIFLSHW